MPEKLNRKLRSGLKWAALSTVARSLVSVITLFALVTFLGVEEYGKLALVSVVLTFSHAIGNMGISQAVIQDQDLKNRDLDTVFLTNLGLGCVMALVLFIFKTPIAWAVGSEEIAPLIALASIVFLISPVGYLYKAILQKHLNLRILETTSFVCILFSSGVSIAIAAIGLGAICVVYGAITQSILEALILIVYFFRKRLWMPSMRFSLASIRKLYRFGIFVTAKSLLNQIGRDIDNIVIARIVGVEAVGIYNLGKQIIHKLAGMVSSVMAKVIFPYFSALRSVAKHEDNKDTKHEISKTYLTIVERICMLASPIFLFIAILPSGLLVELFGPQWEGAGLVLRIFAIKAIFDLVSSGIMSSLLYAHGNASFLFYLDLFITPIRIVLYVAGAFYFSLSGVAWMYLAALLIKNFILQAKINKVLDISWPPVLASFAYRIAPAISAGMLTIGFAKAFSLLGAGLILKLFIFSVAFFAILTALYRAFLWKETMAILRFR